jgi:hypothetical protein
MTCVSASLGKNTIARWIDEMLKYGTITSLRKNATSGIQEIEVLIWDY